MTANSPKSPPEASFVQVKPRLARLIKEPGGLTHEHALKDARRNLDQMRDECIAAIDANLARMDQKFGHAVARPSAEALDELYRLSNEIISTAGLFGLEALGQAAFSLCEVVDRLNTSGRWDWPAVELHLSGLRVLRRADPNDPGAAAVLEGLRQLVGRLSHNR